MQKKNPTQTTTRIKAKRIPMIMPAFDFEFGAPPGLEGEEPALGLPNPPLSPSDYPNWFPVAITFTEDLKLGTLPVSRIFETSKYLRFGRVVKAPGIIPEILLFATDNLSSFARFVKASEILPVKF
jgi:hypothetical protein